MSSRRLIRVNELLKREIASELFRVMNEGGFDLSAVTVTRVATSPDLRHARVMISVRDHEEERNAMLTLLRRHRRIIQQHLNDHTNLKYTPHLHFVLDESVEQGDRILSILSEMDEQGLIPDDDQPFDEITEGEKE